MHASSGIPSRDRNTRFALARSAGFDSSVGDQVAGEARDGFEALPARGRTPDPRWARRDGIDRHRRLPGPPGRGVRVGTPGQARRAVGIRLDAACKCGFLVRGSMIPRRNTRQLYARPMTLRDCPRNAPTTATVRAFRHRSGARSCRIETTNGMCNHPATSFYSYPNSRRTSPWAGVRKACGGRCLAEGRLFRADVSRDCDTARRDPFQGHLACIVLSVTSGSKCQVTTGWIWWQV